MTAKQIKWCLSDVYAGQDVIGNRKLVRYGCNGNWSGEGEFDIEDGRGMVKTGSC